VNLLDLSTLVLKKSLINHTLEGFTMEMFEISYTFNYRAGAKHEINQVTEEKLKEILDCEAKGEYYSNVKVLKELGAENKEWIPTWLEIGKNNHWISRAVDPVFDEDSFSECKTIEYLIQKFIHGNWSLGQAFYYKNLCFINQVNGGDEWLVIKEDLAFESASCGYMAESESYLTNWIEDCLNATKEQLKNLDYRRAI
jgi:hypothetical protein